MTKKKSNKKVEYRKVSVEEAKVPSANYRFYRTGQKGYLKEGDSLIAVCVTSVLVDLKYQAVTSELIDAHNIKYIRVNHYDLFKSKELFEANSPIDRDEHSTEHLLTLPAISRLSKCKRTICDVEEIGGGAKKYNVYLSVWLFENGEAINTPLSINSVAINTDSNGWFIVDGHLPDEFWCSREEAYMHNEYKIVDEDGEVFIEKGIGLRLKPTNTQLAIIKKLRDTFREARDSGLKFIWDRDYCGDVFAINGLEVAKMNYGPDNCGGDCLPISCVDAVDTGICFFDYNKGDDEYSIVLKPTPRQQKLLNKNKS